MSSNKSSGREDVKAVREACIQELVKLTQAEMQAGSQYEAHESMALSRHIIEPLLKDNQERVLVEAISRAGEAGGRYASLILRSNIEALASEYVVAEAGGEQLRGGLFALPVQVFSREPGLFVGGAVPPDAFDGLATAARRQGLLRAESRVGFVPYLYQDEEVAGLEFGQIRQLTEQVVRGVAQLGRAPAAGKELGQTAQADRLRDSSLYTLSFKVIYLLFAVVGSADHVPFTSVKDGLIDLDSTDKALAGWVKDVTPLVRNAFGGDRVLVHVGHPRAFCAALREGAENYRGSHFQVRLLDHLKMTGTFPQALRAVVTAHGTDGYLEEYRVSALDSTGALVFGEVYPYLPWEDFDEVEHALELHLRHEGFADVEFQEELLPNDKCGDCETPVFVDRENTEERVSPARPTLH